MGALHSAERFTSRLGLITSIMDPLPHKDSSKESDE
jgi:hypothetical protein